MSPLLGFVRILCGTREPDLRVLSQGEGLLLTCHGPQTSFPKPTHRTPVWLRVPMLPPQVGVAELGQKVSMTERSLCVARTIEILDES